MFVKERTMNRTRLFRERSTKWCLAGAVAFLGAISPERTVLAETADDETSACVDAYEHAQERRLAGALMEARERFALCSSASCPAFIQADCSRFLEGVNVEIPTVSFDVKRGNRPLATIRILETENVLYHGATKTPIEFDPGRHELRFEAPGAEPVTRSFVIESGEKNRLVEVELPLLVAPAPPPRNTAPIPVERSIDPAPWVVLGLGTAGVGAFAILGSLGLSEERRLERTCAPSCSAKEIRSVRTKYLFADIGIAVGVTGLLAGGYLLLTSEPEPARRAAELPLLVGFDRHGGAASLKGQF
jgi:hypothetical protein